MSQSADAPDDWPGRSLGLPVHGPGSLARVGRRVGALVIDWAACSVLSAAFFGYDSLATLLLFTAEQLLFVALLGGSFGHVLLGMRVHVWTGSALDVSVRTTPPPLRSVLIRTLLLVLVIPALIPDAHGRGTHDKAAGTVLLRRQPRP